MLFNRAAAASLPRRMLLGGAAAIVIPRPTIAQTWPARPVVVLGGGGPGGATYVVARTMGDQLQAQLGQPFVLETRPGPASFAAAIGTLNAPADGYTVFMTSASSHGIAPFLFRNLPFDMHASFVPVSRICIVPNVLYVRAGSPIESLASLVAQARARPGAMNIAALGQGTTTHLAGVLLETRARIDYQMVQYRGSAAVATAVLSQEVDAGFDLIPGIIGQIRGGAVRPLAVTTAERSPELPDVPTIGELSFGPYDVGTWFGFVMRLGTAPAIVARLAGAVRAASTTAVVLERFRTLGATPAYLDAEDFAAFLSTEPRRWRPIVQASGVQLDF